MTESDIMAELSYACLHAVAAPFVFGYIPARRIDDGTCGDAFVRVNLNLKLDHFFGRKMLEDNA